MALIKLNVGDTEIKMVFNGVDVAILINNSRWLFLNLEYFDEKGKLHVFIPTLNIFCLQTKYRLVINN